MTRAAIVCFSLFLSLTPGHALPKWVVIDPGHGGKDNGAFWGGVREKTLALDLAQRVSRILQSRGYRSTFTRTSDKAVSLDQRIDLANKFPNALFVSLHFNAHLNRSITGFEVWYHPGSTNASRFASTMRSSIAKKTDSRDRGTKPKTNLKVLRKTKGTAILIECGFLSNSSERKKCDSAWYRQILAEAIVDGIVRFRP